MAERALMFGLSEAIVRDLRGVFAKYPEVESVLIFGSRAKTTFKEGSDIDLAVFAPAMGDERFAHLWNDLDSLPLVFKMDILHWDTLRNGRLKHRIPAEGRLLYRCQNY